MYEKTTYTVGRRRRTILRFGFSNFNYTAMYAARYNDRILVRYDMTTPLRKCSGPIHCAINKFNIVCHNLHMKHFTITRTRY